MKAAAIVLALSLAFSASVVEAAPRQRGYPVVEKSIAELQADMAAGRTTSEAITRAYLARIEAVDRAGPTLRSVIAVNPEAIAQARALDAERRAGRVRGPLHGVPVLIKDNIETVELPTTAGSLALRNNRTERDAPVAARLRAAGAVILGKTNLSEWANIRSSRSISGWSAVGGQVRNPYMLDRNPCGSSSGSGAAAAASLAAATVGTETDGSVVCPSTANGLVGLKPTVGLVSRTRVVPISHSQDTPGPMARSVQDAALMLNAMAGSDAADSATREADARRTDYVRALDAEALRGKRVGVMRFNAGFHPEVDAVFEQALAALKAAGAELVEIKDAPAGYRDIGTHEGVVLYAELKADMAAYLASTDPAEVPSRTLADLIAFNTANAGAEMPLFRQETFEAAEKTKGLTDPDYLKALETGRRLAGPEGLDKLLTENRVDVLVAPTGSPAWPIDPYGDGGGYRGGGTSRMPAVSGYPHLTVPMGFVRGLPVGLSFIGPAWSEGRLLSLGYAFEQRTKARRAPIYAPSMLAMPEVAPALRPAR